MLMRPVEPTAKGELPSFSIVLETENLANANIDRLSASLASLLSQDCPLAQANEVLLIESGDIPTNLLQQLCQQYPWIKVHSTPLATGYYKAKMLGAELATGEIIVYCDSDCIYEPTWLSTILTTFAHRGDIQIVAGETTTSGVGAYGTAMALTYIFPQYSGERGLVSTSEYFLNNVAFRRSLLLTYPIPTNLPLYRGNCVVHAYELCQNNQIIWRQPQARATHAPPDGLAHFFWRFLLIGHDYYWQNRLLKQSNQQTHLIGSKSLLTSAAHVKVYRAPIAGFQGKIRVFFDRTKKMVKTDFRHFLYFPLSVPIATVSVLLIFAGYMITAFKPTLLLRVYNNVVERPS